MCAPRRLIIKCSLCPGDILMLTAAIRDLHFAHSEQFQTDVRTSSEALWANNPYVTALDEDEPGVEVIEAHYPLIARSNQAPYHFIHGFVQFFEQRLQVPIPLTSFRGDIHLSVSERRAPSPLAGIGYPNDFWVIVAGGKYDFTAKWWNPASYQRVVDHFRGKIQFVQCGEANDWHPRLRGVLDFVGKTSIRQFVQLIHHADGVLCPVTFAMHLAAAVPGRPQKPVNRACVVVAGGREPAQWAAYPHHQYIGTNGALPCCSNGGCWKARCQTIPDGDLKNNDVCLLPVQVSETLRIPRCLDMIRVEDVIRRIELYYEGGMLKYERHETTQIQ